MKVVNAMLFGLLYFLIIIILMRGIKISHDDIVGFIAYLIAFLYKLTQDSK